MESVEAWIIFFSQKVDTLGGLAIVIGRWTPLAAMVPAMCAVLSMPYRKFVVWSAIGCLGWCIIWNIIVYLVVRGYMTLAT